MGIEQRIEVKRREIEAKKIQDKADFDSILKQGHDARIQHEYEGKINMEKKILLAQECLERDPRFKLLETTLNDSELNETISVLGKLWGAKITKNIFPPKVRQINFINLIPQEERIKGFDGYSIEKIEDKLANNEEIDENAINQAATCALNRGGEIRVLGGTHVETVCEDGGSAWGETRCYSYKISVANLFVLNVNVDENNQLNFSYLKSDESGNIGIYDRKPLPHNSSETIDALIETFAKIPQPAGSNHTEQSNNILANLFNLFRK